MTAIGLTDLAAVLWQAQGFFRRHLDEYEVIRMQQPTPPPTIPPPPIVAPIQVRELGSDGQQSVVAGHEALAVVFPHARALSYRHYITSARRLRLASSLSTGSSWLIIHKTLMSGWMLSARLAARAGSQDLGRRQGRAPEGAREAATPVPGRARPVRGVTHVADMHSMSRGVRGCCSRCDDL